MAWEDLAWAWSQPRMEKQGPWVDVVSQPYHMSCWILLEPIPAYAKFYWVSVICNPRVLNKTDTSQVRHGTAMKASCYWMNNSSHVKFVSSIEPIISSPMKEYIFFNDVLFIDETTEIPKVEWLIQYHSSSEPLHMALKISEWGFPGGAVVENLPANAEDTGSSPGLRRSHMPRSDWAREPQLLSLRVWSQCSATREAVIVRGPRTAMKSGPHSPQL